MNKLILISSLLVLLLGACKIPQRLKNNHTANNKAKSPEELKEILEKQRINYHSFEAKAKIEVKTEKENVKFSSTIKIKKDSLIWINFKKMSVEGARVRISPKEIEILDHQNNEYFKKPYSFLKEEFQIPLNFQELQDILVGNPIFLDKYKYQYSEKENFYLLENSKNAKDYLAFFFNKNTLELSKIEADYTQNELLIEFLDYRLVQDQKIAWTKRIKIESETGELNKIEIDFQQLKLDELLKFVFNVPEHYKKID